MAKDVNIHVKTTGAEQAKAEFQQLGQATEEMGAKTSRAGGWKRHRCEPVHYCNTVGPANRTE